MSETRGMGYDARGSLAHYRRWPRRKWGEPSPFMLNGRTLTVREALIVLQREVDALDAAEGEDEDGPE